MTNPDTPKVEFVSVPMSDHTGAGDLVERLRRTADTLIASEFITEKFDEAADELTASSARIAEQQVEASKMVQIIAELDVSEARLKAQVATQSQQIAALTEQVSNLWEALAWLVNLKDDPPSDYEEQKPRAWENARAALQQSPTARVENGS